MRFHIIECELLDKDMEKKSSAERYLDDNYINQFSKFMAKACNMKKETLSLLYIFENVDAIGLYPRSQYRGSSFRHCVYIL